MSFSSVFCIYPKKVVTSLWKIFPHWSLLYLFSGKINGLSYENFFSVQIKTDKKIIKSLYADKVSLEVWPNKYYHLLTAVSLPILFAIIQSSITSCFLLLFCLYQCYPICVSCVSFSYHWRSANAGRRVFTRGRSIWTPERKTRHRETPKIFLRVQFNP